MKIAITNIVALNGGDAAILLGTIKALKRTFGENIEINVFSSEPEACARLYPDIHWNETLGLRAHSTPYARIRILGRIARCVKIFKYRIAVLLASLEIPLYKLIVPKTTAKAVADYKTSDIVISTGGTYLIEPYGLSTQYLDYLLTLRLHRPLVFYTQSMGPFTRKVSRQHMNSIFSRCSLMMFRDQKSMDNVTSLGLTHTPPMIVTADAAFALGDADKVLARNTDTINNRMKAAISVREWAHFNGRSKQEAMQPYYRAIADAAIKLILRGYTVSFFSTCQGIKEYTDDSLVVEKILKLIPTQYHTQIENTTTYLSVGQIMERLSDVDLIISTRLHMCILSLICGTPVFPIAYEFKTSQLFKSLGYDTVIELESIDTAVMASGLDRFIESYDRTYRHNVNSKVVTLISQAQESADMLKNVIDQRKPS